MNRAFETIRGETEHIGGEELRMLRAVMSETACDAARFGFASCAFHRCQVRAWRVFRDGASRLPDSVPVELVVTRRSMVLSHELGQVNGQVFDE